MVCKKELTQDKCALAHYTIGLARVAFNETAQNLMRVRRIFAVNRRHKFIGLILVKKAMLLVCIDPDRKSLSVSFRMKLGRINIFTDAEH